MSTVTPILALLALTILSVIARRSFMRPGLSPTASAAIVMAIGIFALKDLQDILVPDLSMFTQILALELAVIGALTAASYLRTGDVGFLSRHTSNPIPRFSIGTWVAGTSVIAQLILLALPGWHDVAVILFVLGAVLWLWYMTLVIPGFRAIAAGPVREHAKGRILLATVSTQAMVILALKLFPSFMPLWASIGFILLGAAFYVTGLLLIAVRYIGQRSWNLADDWDDTNCILHGAVSITGLAAVISLAFPESWLIGAWVWTAGMFVVVEAIELARVRQRVRRYGWKRGLFSYNVAQWARNFTFGMFFAFTFRIDELEPTADRIGPLSALWSAILYYGKYVVLAFLVAEVVLYLQANVRFRQWPDTALDWDESRRSSA